jgi:hypothetical protein
MSEQVKFIMHQGKKILIEDFSNMVPGPKFDELIDEARHLIHSQPEKSVLALFIASGIRFDSSMVNSIKQFTVSNNDFMRAAAVIGIDGLLSVVLNIVIAVSGRKIMSFATREQALAWLVSQP